MNKDKKGISVIICTYNGATRLPETVAHLARQEIAAHIKWEVLLIDNASIDNTLAVVENLAQQFPFLFIRIDQETIPGKIHALNKGFALSAFSYLVICGDDNWLNEKYLQSAFNLMEENPTFGVMSGPGEGFFELPPPDWFHQFKDAFAISNHGNLRQDITDTLGSIWGAGMVIRKSAYSKLIELGFKNLLVGGIGTKRTSGEDTEICLALRLLGYRIIYEPSLHFQHFMPASRVRWETLIDIYKANGAASIFYQCYHYHFARLKGEPYPVSTHWEIELVNNLKFLINFRTWLKYFFQKHTGNIAVLKIERQIAKIRALLTKRTNYNKSFKRIQALTELATTSRQKLLN